VSQVSHPREDYLERLEELLPHGEAARVRMEVDALIQDRADEEARLHPDLPPAETERRALEALGSPEALAEELSPTEMRIPLATRRTFVRILAAVFACHLLLAVVLTVAGSRSAPIPGLLGPLPQGPFSAVLLAVITLFLLDTGGLLVLFVAIGRVRPERPLPSLPALARSARWSRRGAVEGLVLLILLAVLFDGLLDQVFAVRQGDELVCFLAPELLALVPFVNVVFGLFALRHLLTLAGRGSSAWSLALDALGSLAGCGLLVAAATRSELVRMPAGSKLGREAADVLAHLTERLFLLVFVVGALLLIVRFVLQAIRLSRRLRS
jgi:hypothetical protein